MRILHLIGIALLCTGSLFAADTTQTISLFDGQTLDGWTTQDGQPVSDGWTVQDGAIYRESKSGHIYHQQPVEGDFELTFDWKIAAKVNSGLKYRVTKYGNKLLGCEYQLYDDRGNPFTLKSAGALYALYEPQENKQLNPVGEWNTAKVVVRGTVIQHWLNGQKIVEADMCSDQWRERLAASKFSPHEDFARNRVGRIMLQDHGGDVWFRNLQLTLLPDPVAAQ